MKVCAACQQELPAAHFSRKQWKLKQYQRRCMDCIADDRSSQAGTPSPSLMSSTCTEVTSISSELGSSTSSVSSDTSYLYEKYGCDGDSDSVPSCYICLDEGVDELGQPLVRDCSCRGTDAGFAHLHCIANYAEQKSQHWDGHDMYQLIVHWKVCPNCHQPYQNEPAIELANRFISYVEKTHPNDKGLAVAALKLKLGALGEFIYRQNMITSHSNDDKKKEEATATASKLLATIDQMRHSSSRSSRRVSNRILQIEAFVYFDLGQICFSEKTTKSAREAVLHFEKCRDLFEAMDIKASGVAAGISAAENSIAATMLRLDGNIPASMEKKLEHSRNMYKLCVEEYGEDDGETLKVGTNLAIDLRNTKHTTESLRLLTKLMDRSRRVHGIEHSLTKRIETTLQQYKVRRVLYQSQDGRWKKYRALRYEEEDRKNIVLQGPIHEPRCDERTFTVPSTAILPSLGTPIVCYGFGRNSFMGNLNGKVGDLRSWDKDTGSYEVHFEQTDLWSCSLKSENFHILFDLPERTGAMG